MGEGAKIIDRDTGWSKLFKAVEVARGERYAKVGVLADTEKGGMLEEGASLTVAQIAGVLEFGTEDGHIPERSFLRATFDEEREELTEKAGKFIIEVLFGKMTVDQGLNAIGAMLANAVKRKITDGAGVPPPNAPSTAMEKVLKGKTRRLFGADESWESAWNRTAEGEKVERGFIRRAARSFGEGLAQAAALAAVRPLVDTGRLLGAITWAIVSEKKGNSEE